MAESNVAKQIKEKYAIAKSVYEDNDNQAKASAKAARKAKGDMKVLEKACVSLGVDLGNLLKE